MAYQNPRPEANASSIKSHTSARKHCQQASRTYVYKMTIDDGVAPCAPPATPNNPAILTLAICKPAIRRTAKPGNRIFGITSKSIAKSQGYPLNAIIYSAVVDSIINSQAYSDPTYSDRLDSIYSLDATTGQLTRRTTTNIHTSPQDQKVDLGLYPSYKSARVLLCTDFRYFGSQAVPIPDSFPHLLHASRKQTQAYRVFNEGDETARELEDFAVQLWEKETRYTPYYSNAGRSARCVPREHGKHEDDE